MVGKDGCRKPHPQSALAQLGLINGLFNSGNTCCHGKTAGLSLPESFPPLYNSKGNSLDFEYKAQAWFFRVANKTIFKRPPSRLKSMCRLRMPGDPLLACRSPHLRLTPPNLQVSGQELFIMLHHRKLLGTSRKPIMVEIELHQHFAQKF